MKETVKSGPFEKFCLKKGLDRDKDLWERMAEKETEMKETVLKEIKLERKSERSRRKKIELYKNCKQKLTELVDNWKETLGSEEETLFGKLKETAMIERSMKKLGSQRIEFPRKFQL